MGLYAPLIDNSYFIGELTISMPQNSGVDEELIFYRRTHEYDFLIKLMGQALYNAFYTGVKEATVADRWQKMAFGLPFILDHNKVKTGCSINSFGTAIPIPRYRYFDKMNVNYKGLLKRASDTDNTDKLNDNYGAHSPIANYIFYWWERAHVTAPGTAGNSKQQVHNGQALINNQKMIRAWNDMCLQVFEFYLFLDMYIADYPEFDLEVNSRFNPAPINEFNFL